MPSTNKIAIEFTEEQWKSILYQIELGIECYYLDYYNDDNEAEKVPVWEEVRDTIRKVFNITHSILPR